MMLTEEQIEKAVSMLPLMASVVVNEDFVESRANKIICLDGIPPADKLRAVRRERLKIALEELSATLESMVDSLSEHLPEDGRFGGLAFELELKLCRAGKFPVLK